ncbi:MAG TPA: hypothetical protein VGC75_04915, partial [Candidatus Nitrosocosmicus sp.]
MKYHHIFILLVIIFTFQIAVPNIKLILNKDHNIIPSILAQVDTNKSDSQRIDYYARFNCGTIDNDNGPLRPGKYDSDITIFNKQSFPLTVIWKSIEINQENKNNFQIINIQPENIVNINCAKIFPSSSSTGNSNLKNGFSEGVALIRINTNNGQLINNFFNSQGSSVIIGNQELGDLINVDVLHTVNTLSASNKTSAFYLKVDFSIIDLSKKINGDIYKNNLTAILSIEPNNIIDPIDSIKNILYNNISSNLHQSLINTT